MGSNLEVKATLDVTSLVVESAKARAEMQALGSELRKLAGESAKGLLDDAGEAQIRQVAEDFAHAKAKAKELSDQMREMHDAGGGVGEALEDIRGKMSSAFEVTGIAAAVEAVRGFVELLEKFGARATQVHTMSEVLGVTTDQFQAMGAAAAAAGVPDEQFAHAAERLSIVLTEARGNSSAAIQKLYDLGVTTAQLGDPTFKLNQLLGVLRDRLLDTSIAENERNEILKILGTRGAAAIEVIKGYDGSNQGVAERLGNVNALSEDQITILHEMHAAWDEVGISASNAASKMIAAAGSAWEALQKGMGAKKDIGVARWADEEQGRPAAPEHKKETAGHEGQSRIERFAAEEEEESAAPTARKESVDVAVQSAQAQISLQHEIAEQELENIKAGVEAYKEGTAERLNQLRIYKAAATQYYGSSDVDTVKRASNEIIAEQRKVAEEQKRIADEQAREQSRMYTDIANKARESMTQGFKAITGSAAESARGQEEAQIGAIDREIAAVQELGRHNSISGQQELSEVRELLNQRWAAQQAYYDKLKALYANDQQALARIYAQESASYQQYANSLQKEQRLVTTRIEQQWEQMGNRVTSVIGQVFKSMMAGTLTFSNFMRGAAQQVADNLISNFTRAEIRHLASERAQSAASQASSAIQGQAAREAADQGLTASGTAALKKIYNDAAQAASGAYQAMVGIPYVGPIIAPIAAAAAFTAVLAFDSGVASAEGGWDVPSSAKPIPMIAHSKEMMLPQKYADVIRGMADGGSGNGGPRPGGSINVKFTPTGSGYGLVHMGNLADALKQLNNRFSLG